MFPPGITPNMFNLPGFSSLPGLTPNMMLPALPGFAPGIPGMQQPRTVEATKASRHHVHHNNARKRERFDRPAEEEKEDAPPGADSPAILSLLEEKKRVESLLSQRRIDVRDSLQPLDRHKRKIRVTVTNMHAHQQPPQPYQSVSATPSEPPSWTLAIHGRILDASDPSGALVLPQGAPPPMVSYMNSQGQTYTVPSPNPVSSASRGHFSDYVRRMEVQLDPVLYPEDGGLVVWDKALAHGSPPKDVFEVKRAGSQPCIAKVKLWMDWKPERFKLPLPLATAMGTHYETRTRVLQLMAQYVTKNRLVDPKTPGWVRLPTSLAEVLAPEELKQQQQQQQQQGQQQQGGRAAFTQAILAYDTLMERVSQVLEAMPPLEITHSIQLTGPPRAAHAIDVDFDFGTAPLGSSLAEQRGTRARQGAPPPPTGAVPSQPCEKELLQMEGAGQRGEALAADLSRAERLYNEAKRRRTALLGFVQAPLDFINGLAATQTKELRVSRGQQQATAYSTHNLPKGAAGLAMFQQNFHPNAAMYATEFECKRRSALFREPWVEDAILADRVYVNKRAQRQAQLPLEGPHMF